MTYRWEALIPGWGHYRGYTALGLEALRNKLFKSASMYDRMGFAIEHRDFLGSWDSGTKKPGGEDVDWPLYGFILGGHGNSDGVEMFGDSYGGAHIDRNFDLRSKAPQRFLESPASMVSLR